MAKHCISQTKKFQEGEIRDMNVLWGKLAPQTQSIINHHNLRDLELIERLAMFRRTFTYHLLLPR